MSESTCVPIPFHQRVRHPRYPGAVAELRGAELADDDSLLGILRWLDCAPEVRARMPAWLPLAELERING